MDLDFTHELAFAPFYFYLLYCNYGVNSHPKELSLFLCRIPLKDTNSGSERELESVFVLLYG